MLAAGLTAHTLYRAGDGHCGNNSARGPADRGRDGRNTRLALSNGLRPAAAAYSGKIGGGEAGTVEAAVQAIGLLPCQQNLSGGPGLHRERCAHRNRVAQAHGALGGGHADALIALAAEELSLTPSAVSHRMNQLEEELGVQLFLREKKRLYPTDKAHTLYGYARKILAMVDEAEDRVRGMVPGGKFRIGALESAAAVRLPEVLARLHAGYPQIALELVIGMAVYLPFMRISEKAIAKQEALAEQNA